MGLGLKPLGGFVKYNKKTLRKEVGVQVIILTLICLKEKPGALPANEKGRYQLACAGRCFPAADSIC